MTDQRRNAPYLRAVVSRLGAAPIELDLFRAAPQGGLFASGNSALLGFIHVEGLSDSDFRSLIGGARAKAIVDFRPVPRFDIGSLTRKVAFSIFAESGSKYFDFSGRLGVSSRRDSRLNPEILGQELRSFLNETRLSEGPLLFFLDASQFTSEYVTVLAGGLQSMRAGGWDVMQIPSPVTGSRPAANAKKSMVFVSHANPEDNDFAAWLASRLTLAGYQVWSDVTKLIGGELFWTTIEEAIRQFSAKFIIVLSRAAQNKHGVLDEVNCAVSYERATGISNFVVPVRLDSIPFEEVHANVARKNIIDFSENWAVGLTRIFGVLTRDGVPKIDTGAYLPSLVQRAFGAREETVFSVDTLSSNWLRISRIPDRVGLWKESASETPVERRDELTLPSQNAPRINGYFARLRSKNPTHTETGESVLDVADILQNGVRTPVELVPRQASNLVTHLLRQLWASNMRALGLRGYPLSSGAIAWYPPLGLISGDNVSFNDMKGKRRRKYLLGRSEKRNAYWHFALEARPVIARVSRFVLIAHVVFTEDGFERLLPASRMHSLRRQFCKNWWNDRWRDLTLAYLAFLSGTSREIVLKERGEEVMRLPSMTVPFKCPVSPSAAKSSEHYDELMAEVEWEDLDVVEDDDAEEAGSDDAGVVES